VGNFRSIFAKSGLADFFCPLYAVNMIAGSHLPDGEARPDELTSWQGNVRDGFSSGIFGRLLTAILDRVPLGYEDESGFHLRANSGSVTRLRQLLGNFPKPAGKGEG